MPLSGRAFAILHDVRRRSDGTGLVFRSPRGKPLSNMTLSKLIKELGIAAVPHGFRSSFRSYGCRRQRRDIGSISPCTWYTQKPSGQCHVVW